MKVYTTDPFWLFVKLHFDSIKMIFCIDLLFLVCSMWYIGVQLPQNADYFRASVLVFLVIIVFTVLNMRVISVCMGSPEYYRMLPINGKTVMVKAHILLITPFMAALCLILLFLFCASLIINIDMLNIVLKIGQIFTVFCTIRLLTLPTFLLMRKGLLYLCAFYLLIIPIVLLVMAFDELFWSAMPLSLMWDMATFILMLFILELGVVAKCK